MEIELIDSVYSSKIDIVITAESAGELVLVRKVNLVGPKTSDSLFF